MELVRHPPMNDWVGKIELIDGEIVHMSPANNPHWLMARAVTLQLQSIFGPLESEWLAGPEPTVRFANKSVRLPDIGVFHSPKLTETIFAVADLFLGVEIADTTLHYDLGRKRAAYAEAGVPHYWVVDVNGRKTHVMAEPEAGDYGSKRTVVFGDPIAVPGTESSIIVE